MPSCIGSDRETEADLTASILTVSDWRNQECLFELVLFVLDILSLSTHLGLERVG